MRELPILFNDESVRGILAGRKTQTRRVIKPQPSAGIRRSVFVPSGIEDGHGRELRWPYEIGDHLYVRETVVRKPNCHCISWATYGADLSPMIGPPEKQLLGRAMWWHGEHRDVCPSIFMPKWATRLWLEVLEVRVERVQDVSMHDALAEGADPKYSDFHDGSHCVGWFKRIWDNLSAKRGFAWDMNPWVWVIEFKRLESKL